MDSFEFSHNHMRKILLLFPFLEKRNWGTQGLVPCLKSHSSQVAMLELEQSQYGDFKASRMIREYARESCAWSGKDEKCSFGRQFSSIIFSSSLSLFIFSWFKGGLHSHHLPFEKSHSIPALLPLWRRSYRTPLNQENNIIHPI